MNTLAYVLAGTGTLFGILIHLLVLVLIFALVWWVLTLIPLPSPIQQVVRVIFAIIAVIILISFLLGIAGCATDPATGQQRPLTPAEAQAYAAAGHTIIQGAVSDYKEVKAATH